MLIFPPESSSIKLMALVIDAKERGLIHTLAVKQAAHEVRCLPVGDVLCTYGESVGFPWVMGRKRADDLAASLKDSRWREQSARLFRKIEYLSVIGNIAPMVGLLGTVIGMIMAFQEVASTQGMASAPQLAQGIYQALITTVGGLIVAIPAIGAFAIFRNRIDQFVAEAAFSAQNVFAPLRRKAKRKGAE